MCWPAVAFLGAFLSLPLSTNSLQGDIVLIVRDTDSKPLWERQSPYICIYLLLWLYDIDLSSLLYKYTAQVAFFLQMKI